MSCFKICITVIDTPEEQSIENLGDDPVTEEESVLFDQALFEEPQVERNTSKKTRLIQSDASAKEEVLSCLKGYVQEDDIVQVEIAGGGRIQFIVDMSSEECVLLNLASTEPMTITDLKGDISDMSSE